MEVITKFLKEKCLYDRLKDRIKSNLKTVGRHPTDKVKPAIEQFERFRNKQDGVLAMYLVWDALDTLKLTNTMYLFRHETGFDPSKITNPHVLRHMHELIKDRRHCDVIMEHTMNWYTRDYTPRTDKCCQHKILLGLNREVGIKQREKSALSTSSPIPSSPIIEKRNLLDGMDSSRVTVSIHVGDDDDKPKVIEIPRDTVANNISIYLKSPKPPSSPSPTPPLSKLTTENIGKIGPISQGDADVSSDSTTTFASIKTTNSKSSLRRSSRGKSRSNSRSSTKSREDQDILGDENDEHGIRRGFRRSASPSRSSLSLKGGRNGLDGRNGLEGKNSCPSIDSVSYVHNPELHALFKEELRKIKERNRRGGNCSSERSCRMPTPVCRSPPPVCLPPVPVCPPPRAVCEKPATICPQQLRINSVHEGETLLTGHLVHKHLRPTCPPPPPCPSPPPPCNSPPPPSNSNCQPMGHCGRPPSPQPRVLYTNHKPRVTKTPSVPHLVNQCAQAQGNDLVNPRMCGNTLLLQPPHPRRSDCGSEGREEPVRQCFNEQVRRGTEDLINSAEVTRRYMEVLQQKDADTELLKCEMAGGGQKECKLGFAQNISRRLDKLRNNENISKLGRLCGSLIQRPQATACRSVSQSPTRCHQECDNRPRPHSHGRSCGPASAGDAGCNENYRPEVLSEFDGVN